MVMAGLALGRHRPSSCSTGGRNENGDTVVYFAVCDRKTTALSARRPCAGSVPGVWGACLAVRTPHAAFVLVEWFVLVPHVATRLSAWRDGGSGSGGRPPASW